MIDIFDRASDLENHSCEETISAYRNVWSTTTCNHCEDCGEPLSEARSRVITDCHRCISCQEIHENFGL